MESRIAFIVGEPRSGKTTAVQRIMNRSRLRFGGMYCVADDGRKREFRLVLVGTQGKCILDAPLISPLPLDGVSLFRKFELDNAAAASMETLVGSADVLVVDELGYLQLSCAVFMKTVLRLMDAVPAVLLTCCPPALNHPLMKAFLRRRAVRRFFLAPSTRLRIVDEVVAFLEDGVSREAASPGDEAECGAGGEVGDRMGGGAVER